MRDEVLCRQRGTGAQRGHSILFPQRKRFEAGKTKLREGSSSEGRKKRRERNPESVGRPKKHSRAARHDAVEVAGGDRRINAVAVLSERSHRYAEGNEASGYYVLQTSRSG
ncbi:MAG: hypothetical protein OXI01_15625 [Albidovulum sp.]|nr:hypothetical protein [Albidovulum sp.]